MRLTLLATLALALVAAGCLRDMDAQKRYSTAVLVLAEADRAMIDEARQLGRDILTRKAGAEHL